jgi:hypothetical protein
MSDLSKETWKIDWEARQIWLVDFIFIPFERVKEPWWLDQFGRKTWVTQEQQAQLATCLETVTAKLAEMDPNPLSSIARDPTWQDFVELARAMLIDIGLKDYADTGACPVLAGHLLKLRQKPLAELKERLFKLHDKAEQRTAALGRFRLSEIPPDVRREYEDQQVERHALGNAILELHAVATKKPPTSTREE